MAIEETDLCVVEPRSYRMGLAPFLATSGALNISQNNKLALPGNERTNEGSWLWVTKRLFKEAEPNGSSTVTA